MLDVLIASVEDRKYELKILLNEFHRQGVNPIVIVDNKELSIGSKRQKLLELATQEWIVFFDDDDWPNQEYVSLIESAILSDDTADCCGIWGRMTTNGKNLKTWGHRLGWPVGERRFGLDYVRPIIHFNPVKREKALQAGFRDLRFGEDMDYATRLNPLLNKEVFIKEPQVRHLLFLISQQTKEYPDRQLQEWSSLTLPE